MRTFTPAQKQRRAEYLRRWRAENPEKNRAIARAWEARNAVRMREVRQEWHKKNRDRTNARAREKYAADPTSARLKLKQKRERAGIKYREQIKRSRARVRATPEGRIYHRLGQAIRSALRGAKRRCRWERVLGYTRADLRRHLEAQFTDGMTWERFLAGDIHIDHVKPRMAFSYSSMTDPQFTECWALANLRPMWADDNCSFGARARWSLGFAASKRAIQVKENPLARSTSA